MNARKRSSPWGQNIEKGSAPSVWPSPAPYRRRPLRLAVKAIAETGASVTAAEGKSRQEIQDELDAIVRDNMMTISVAPVAQLQKGGKLRVNVQNVQDNKFPQRFRVIQNDETVYESGVVETGKTVETCPAGDIREGEAYIEIQALDAKTYDAHGNPTRIKVRVAQAED